MRQLIYVGEEVVMGGGSIHRRDSQELVDLAQTACQLFAHDDNKSLLSIVHKDNFANCGRSTKRSIFRGLPVSMFVHQLPGLASARVFPLQRRDYN